MGQWLVAKESVYEEDMKKARFHTRMAKMQATAQSFAKMFNQRVGGGFQSHIHFVQVVIYEVAHESHKGGKGWILAEPELEGKYIKWNNNAGGVLRHSSQVKAAAAPSTTVVAKAKDNKVLEHQREEDGETGTSNGHKEDVDDVPQCFSHFTGQSVRGRNSFATSRAPGTRWMALS